MKIVQNYKMYAIDSKIFAHDEDGNFYEFNEKKQTFSLALTKERSDEIDKMVKEMDEEKQP